MQSDRHHDLIERVPRSVFGSLMIFPATCFIVAALTDLAYARSANMTWETGSIWLLTLGLVSGGLVVAIGLIQAFGFARWPTMVLRIGYAIALILSLVNAFVHSRDGYTSVVPTGLALSLAVVIVLVVTWLIDLFASTPPRVAAPAMFSTPMQHEAPASSSPPVRLVAPATRSEPSL